ncbi:MAG TPA: MBL fold metallo-hydrolase [Gemmatimonadaceae bacterium]|nr:MBL fold metallo-hydrolase [Gemmatimonadaceae bacterium]
MLLQRFYDDGLAQASYLIACQATGDAVVVDPNRDVDQYVRAAEVDGLRISYVTETHIHADFVSGSRELADRTGARLLLSAEGGADWSYRFAAEAGARLLTDGESFSVGRVRFGVMHTPGHTPEHLALSVTDGAASDRPMGVLTGDFLFVGDVGRPDLLERAAGETGTMAVHARTLFRSLRAFAGLPDYLQIWPGHGAGSACGKSLGAVPQTTLGYEKLTNWAFQVSDETAFVRDVLEGQPEPPRYFAQMKRINRDGPALLGRLDPPPRLPASRLAPLLDQNALIVDTRHAGDFAEGFVRRTINIPLNRSFTTWAGSLIPYDRPFYLIASDDDDRAISKAARSLALIGLDKLGGYFGPEAVSALRGAMATIPQMSARDLASRLASNGIRVLDVRTLAEWQTGHIPGAVHVPLVELEHRISELDNTRPTVVQCQSGSRSAIASSLLAARGFERVFNLVGGIDAWTGGGGAVDRDDTA